jgi:predicted kinase
MPTANTEPAAGRTAADEPAAYVLLRDGFADDELKRIRILPEGARLEPGAVYLDLRDPTRQEILGRADLTVGSGELVVPKAEVGPDLWNRLTRPPGPGQTGG